MEMSGMGISRQGSQSGQAMPLVLAFLVVLCIGLLVTFNTGQVVGKKVELTNAADAAAYSIAVEQARARNLAAYLNRARVANEVTIAQTVSLNSWLTMVHSTSYHFEKFMDVVSTVASIIPPLGAALKAVDKAIAAINKALKAFRKGFITTSDDLIIGGLDKMDHIYALAARAALSDAVSGAEVLAMTNKVIKDNAPDAKLTAIGTGVLTKNVLAANNQLKLHDPKQGKGVNYKEEGGERYRNVVMASRDTFTRARDGTALGVFNNNGGTDLVAYDRWAAVDTFQIKIPIPFAPDFKFALGWGGAQAVNEGQPKFFPGMKSGKGWDSPYDKNNYEAYNGTKSNSISGMFIEADPAGQEMGFKKKKAYFNGYKYGLAQPYYDVSPKKENGEYKYSRIPEGKDAGPIYTVEIGTKVGKARTSSALGMGAGRMELKDQAKDGDIRAMASAQVYFNRPHEYASFKRSVWGKDDGKFEMGSMFSPYWQARLVETPAADRLLLTVP